MSKQEGLQGRGLREARAAWVQALVGQLDTGVSRPFRGLVLEEGCSSSWPMQVTADGDGLAAWTIQVPHLSIWVRCRLWLLT